MLSPNRVDSEIRFQRRIENEEEDSDLRASHEREWDDDADSTADGDQSSEDSGIQTQLASFATVLKDVIIELNKLKQDRQTFSTASRMDTNNNKDASIGASAVESGSATCTRNGVVGPLQGKEYRDGSRQAYENTTSNRRYSMPRYQDGIGEEERYAYDHRYDSERRDGDEDMPNYDRRQAGQTSDSSRYGWEVRYSNDIEPQGVRYVTPLVAKPLPKNCLHTPEKKSGLPGLPNSK
ncbi:hypothetical protein DPMN_153475 [Dreissena polymorpha]|uniref:Uncharacterized protein n=1 Tax=Dreissena polymorpha TaxID=45954 RepID=A0A9D4FK81_DREPO|nr:hypothetical protein DPMN_153475 [Dreissena polymorpha]